MDYSSVLVMLAEFVNYLKQLRDKMISEIPQMIKDGVDFYSKELGDKEQRSKYSFDELVPMRKKLNYLRDFYKLKIYSWYGETYDLCVLYPMLVSVLYEFSGKQSQQISTIKRDGGYMLLDAAGLSFRDFKNYSAPGSLADLARSMGLNPDEYTKGSFPYEWYTRVDQLEAAKRFPAYTCFYSTMGSGALNKGSKYAAKINLMIRQKCEDTSEDRWQRDEAVICQLSDWLCLRNLLDDPVLKEWCDKNNRTPRSIVDEHVRFLGKKFIYDPEVRCHQCDPNDPAVRDFFRFKPKKYNENKELWERMVADLESKNPGDGEKMTMMIFLINNNFNDVKLLTGSIDAYAENYKTKFGLGIHADLSIAKMAQKIALMQYDSELPPIYSPPPKAAFYYKDCRAKLQGGICQVLHRAIYLNERHDDPRIPKAATHAPNGERYVYLEGLDFNSLYPWAVARNLPLGPGILYTLNSVFGHVNNSRFQAPITASSDYKDGEVRFFNDGLYAQKQNTSLESIRWLEYLNWKTYNGKIQHSYNGEEKKIGRHHVDGYTVLDEFISGTNRLYHIYGDDDANPIRKKVIFEFRGCSYHTCPHCKRKPWRGCKKKVASVGGKPIYKEITPEQLQAEDDARMHAIVDTLREEAIMAGYLPFELDPIFGEDKDDLLQQEGPLNFPHEIVIVYACQWLKIWTNAEFANEAPHSPTYPFLYKGAKPNFSGMIPGKPGVTEEDFLAALRAKKFFGLALVDLSSTQKVIDENPFIPPIFAKTELTTDTLNGYMKRVLPQKTVERLYPSEENVFCYNAKNYMATSEMLEFLDNKGVKIKVHYFVEYYKGAPFKKFVANMVKDRVTALSKKNAGLQLVIKLILNAMVGRFALAVYRFLSCSIVGADKMYDAIRSPMLKSTKQLRVEDVALDPLHEIVRRKKNVTEDLALPIQIFVYQERRTVNDGRVDIELKQSLEPSITTTNHQTPPPNPTTTNQPPAPPTTKTAVLPGLNLAGGRAGRTARHGSIQAWPGRPEPCATGGWPCLRHGNPRPPPAGTAGNHSPRGLRPGPPDPASLRVSILLQKNSKLLFMQFEQILRDYLMPGSYKFCYADTDSFILALTKDSVHKCVNPKLKDKWEKEIRPAWFAVDGDDASQKEPGQSWRENQLELGGDYYSRYAQLCNKYTISLLNDANVQNIVKQLAENLNGLLRISVDAWYITKSSNTFTDESGESYVDTRYEIVYPNTWGSLNDTEILRNEKDLDQMLAELEPTAFADKLLQNTFLRRNVYKESNVRLHRILGFQIIVLTYPPSWLNQ
ncbi:Oidioi.mRNA.OKI2018_I69.chr1.g1460.t1.cds [Oikopleura dioica]|uniref:DNA-directed DNA polymerase n=1 Tax=Oikopleura dioica TaxID=34765 RepID=A0ABN7SUB8_OIKDI|nr:Oidioi.mRNA.OKI2018_I69.chr1.g1460.t1.cds [Oikopleura dioica]